MAPSSNHAQLTYDAFAPYYDAFTAHHDYDGWTATLEALALDHGLNGDRLLDVACGTGKSFLPFLDRGYDVTACDVSPAMVALAEKKAGHRARVEVHDMRKLPRLGSFDVVCCLGDAINYMMSEDELASVFAGLKRNLAPDGVVVFDINSLRSYRTFFASLTVVPAQEHVVVWDGHASPTTCDGELAESTLEVFVRSVAGSWYRQRSQHVQRHHPRAAVEFALRRVGLRRVGLYGMQFDGSATKGFNENHHSKAVYIARHEGDPSDESLSDSVRRTDDTC